MAQINQGGDSLASIIAILDGLYLPLAGGTMRDNAQVNHGNGNSYRVAGTSYIQDVVSSAILPINSTQTQTATDLVTAFDLFGTNNSFFGQSAQQETSYISDSVSSNSVTTQIAGQKYTAIVDLGGFDLTEILLPTTRTTRAQETLFNTQYAESIVDYAYQQKVVSTGTAQTRYQQDAAGLSLSATAASGTNTASVTAAGGLEINARVMYKRIANIATTYTANRLDSVIIATPTAGTYAINLYESSTQTGAVLISLLSVAP